MSLLQWALDKRKERRKARAPQDRLQRRLVGRSARRAGGGRRRDPAYRVAGNRRRRKRDPWRTSSPARPGFIGRHLVERLLEREGDIHVLVREGSREQARRADRALGPRRTASSPSSATSTQPLLGVDEAWIDAARGKIEHFFHLAAIYDMTADDERNEVLNVGGTRNAVDARQRARGRHASTTSPRSPSPATVQGPLHRGHVRRGPEACPRLPPDEVRVREARARALQGAVARLPARRSSSATRRPARWTRSTAPTTSSRRSRRLRHALPEWFPLVGPELGLHEHRPGRLRRRRDGPHRPPARPRRPGLPPRRPRSRSARARCSTRSRGPRTRRSSAMRDRQAADRRAAQGRRLDARCSSRRCKDVRKHAPRRPRHPRRGHRARRAHRPQFDTRDTERALSRLGHRGARRWTPTPTAVGLLGAPPRPRPVQGPLVRGRGQRQDRRHHRRLERHRPRRRASRSPPRAGSRSSSRARRRSSRRPRPRSRRRRHGLRLLRRPLRLRRDRRARRAAALRPRARSTCSSTTRAARSAARSRSPTTASTTTSARCSSTTSARSS